MAGRGKTRYHLCEKKDIEQETPTVSVDYGFLGEKVDNQEEHAKVTFLAMKDRQSKAYASHAMPSKGTGDGYAAMRVIRTLDEWGRTEIVLKSDGEPAIVDLKRAIKAGRMELTQMEEAPRGDHQANGEAERAVGEIAGGVRTLKAALERRIGERISIERPIIKWITEYVGVMLTRFKVGRDGRTSFERMKRRKFNKALVEMGEQVMYEVYGNKEKKIEERFREGTYVGLRSVSQEYLVATSEGDVVKTNTIKRRPEEERWNAAAVKGVTGVPWETGERKKRQSAEGNEAEKGEVEKGEENEGPKQRAYKITKLALEKYGYTPGCPGCQVAQGARKQGQHSQDCRDRIEKQMEEEGGKYAEKLRWKRESQNEYLAEKVEKAEGGDLQVRGGREKEKKKRRKEKK